MPTMQQHEGHTYTAVYADRYQGVLNYAVLKDGNLTNAMLEIWGGPETGWGFTGWLGEPGVAVVESGQQNYRTAKAAVAYGLADLVVAAA